MGATVRKERKGEWQIMAGDATISSTLSRKHWNNVGARLLVEITLMKSGKNVETILFGVEKPNRQQPLHNVHL